MKLPHSYFHLHLNDIYLVGLKVKLVNIFLNNQEKHNNTKDSKDTRK